MRLRPSDGCATLPPGRRRTAAVVDRALRPVGHPSRGLFCWSRRARKRRRSVTKHDLLIAASTIWVVITAVLVMFMQAGFAFLEAGLTRMKNAGHIAGKNVLIFAIASIVYYLVGFGIAFGDGNELLGTHGFFPSVDALTSVGQKP